MTTSSIRYLSKIGITNLLLLASLGLSHAEETVTAEENLPIEITADSLLAQDNIGESIYEGNVIITQGQTKITGETVTIFHPERQVNKAIIKGNPATFKKFNPEDQTWVNGQADKITYQTVDKIVILQGNAEVNQADKNHISGPEIIYNLTDKTLSAQGNEAENKRITVTFQPENKSDKPKSEQPSPTQPQEP